MTFQYFCLLKWLYRTSAKTVSTWKNDKILFIFRTNCTLSLSFFEIWITLKNRRRPKENKRKQNVRMKILNESVWRYFNSTNLFSLFRRYNSRLFTKRFTVLCPSFQKLFNIPLVSCIKSITINSICCCCCCCCCCWKIWISRKRQWLSMC
jgi:hypothetical protein